jgi:hypothetical protein
VQGYTACLGHVAKESRRELAEGPARNVLHHPYVVIPRVHFLRSRDMLSLLDFCFRATVTLAVLLGWPLRTPFSRMAPLGIATICNVALLWKIDHISADYVDLISHLTSSLGFTTFAITNPASSQVTVESARFTAVYGPEKPHQFQLGRSTMTLAASPATARNSTLRA